MSLSRKNSSSSSSSQISCVRLSNELMEYRKWKNDEEVGLSQTQNKRELCITLGVFYHVLVSLLLLSMVIICTIYISHLKQHVQRLDGEVNHLQQVSQQSMHGHPRTYRSVLMANKIVHYS